MLCSVCGTQQADVAQACSACAKAATSAHAYRSPLAAPSARHAPLPPGVKGWSWGAFFLNWIWALGNRTWIGLLAIIPYVGFIVAIWLGFKGREMAWKNKRWESVEHFNRVQRNWTLCSLFLFVLPFVLLILYVAVPAYNGYVDRAHEAQRLSAAQARTVQAGQ